MINDTYAYLRVSSKGQTYEQQLEPINQATGGIAKTRIFVDVATGQNTDRVEFKKLMALVKAGKVRHLWVWKLDRLGRNAREIQHTLNICEDNNCVVHCISPGLDTSSPLGKAMLTMLAFFAQMETEQMSERQRLKFAHMRETTRFRMHGCPKGVVSEAVKKLEKPIRTMHQGGMSQKEIARTLGCGTKTVRKVLDSKPGELLTRKEYAAQNPGWSKQQQKIPDEYTLEEWEAMQEPLREVRRKRHKAKKTVED